MAENRSLSDDPREIEIEDIGPNVNLRLYAKPGCVTVLRGRNGAGKTEALETVTALQSKQGRLSHRDGAVSGVARGLGAQIRVTRQGINRRSGELVIESLESSFSIADLVNPPFKSDDARDAHRIKALVQLTGCKADITEFYGLVMGGRLEFDKVVGAAVKELDDPVAMAAAVKRDLETASRAKEQEADGLRKSIRSKMDQNEGVNLKAPHDRGELDQALAEAITLDATLATRQKDASQSKAAADAASGDLSRAKADYNGPTIEQADEQLQASNLLLSHQFDAVTTLRTQLAAAEAEAKRFKTVQDAARLSLTQANSHADTLLSWERTIGNVQEPPPEADILAATQAKYDCRAAVENGVLVREAIIRDREAAVDTEIAKRLEAQAESLRDSSKTVETVLSKAVKGLNVGLDINREWRLVTDTTRGETYFNDLSEGERWPIAIGIAVNTFAQLNQPGLLILPQDAWQDLDGLNRQIVIDSLRNTDMAIMTAEADHAPNAPAGISVEVHEA